MNRLAKKVTEIDEVYAEKIVKVYVNQHNSVS